MPELPEIETVKLQLQKVLVGQRLVGVSDEKYKSVRYKSVKGIRRMGKVLLITFGKDLDLGFHFKMTGQLVYDEKPQSSNPKSQKRIAGGHPSEDFIAKLPNKHTRAIFEFTKGKLFFNDMRKFGWIKINPKFTETLGPEPFSLTVKQFSSLVKKVKKPIKLAIMDQTIIAGVGNIYANDALWEARIDPRVPSNKVTSDKAGLLLKKIKLVLREGIKYGGASVSDYVNSEGLGGTYQDHMRVYKKEGKKCKRCKSIIEKITLGGRGTYFCPKCQT